MSITEEKLNLLRQIIGGAPKKIALLSHTNPDGDTIGAALAWRFIWSGWDTRHAASRRTATRISSNG